ncbi:hypothetical protein SeLEV6574_g00830 [Synchytrium endobioticum]|nr:hypothetical protein SeLEV6574_g00830 [Synchytrium endobioticum]
MFQGYDDFDSHHFPMHRHSSQGFKEKYRAYSVIMMDRNERPEVNYGGKIILPPSALARLSSLHIEYPMLFELFSDVNAEKHTHAGVLEFISEEGRVYLPHWMMATLNLQEGDLINVKNVSLPLGSFVKIQPQSVAFLDITDPKAVLENAFRNFSALTEGDVIQFRYNQKSYDIAVMEAKPSGKGISIVETDLEVDFMPPIGYEEPKLKPKTSTSVLSSSLSSIEEHRVARDMTGFRAFKGSGQRLNGKMADSPSAYESATLYGSSLLAGPPSGNGSAAGSSSNSIRSSTVSNVSATGASGQMSSSSGGGPPAALHLPFGKLFFGYDTVIKTKTDKNNPSQETAPTIAFNGQGQTLRAAKRGPGSSGNGASSSNNKKQ